MLKRFFILTSLSLLITAVTAFTFEHQVEPADTTITTTSLVPDEIKWMSWEEAVQQSKTAPKKIFVYVYKSYCGWCQHMEKTTYKEPNNAAYLNKYFYPVKFNSEEEASVKIGEKVYKAKKKNGKTYHEFVDYITMGQLNTPTIVFLDEKLNLLQPIAGYKDPLTFETIITYYGGNHFLNTPWSMYAESYIPLSERQSASDK